MGDSNKSLTRRRTLKAGASIAGALITLRSGTFRALAQSAGPQLRLDSAESRSNDEDWAKRIEAALGGTQGMFEDNGVFKVELPRTDITGAQIFGVSVKPDFALEGVLTFKRVGGDTAMKFEVVLLDQEVNPVLSAWLKQTSTRRSRSSRLCTTTTWATHRKYDSCTALRWAMKLGSPARCTKLSRRTAAHRSATAKSRPVIPASIGRRWPTFSVGHPS
jgi:uncharacterized protein DUF1259